MEPSENTSEEPKYMGSQSQKKSGPRYRRGRGSGYQSNSQQNSRRGFRASHNPEHMEDSQVGASYPRDNWHTNPSGQSYRGTRNYKSRQNESRDQNYNRHSNHRKPGYASGKKTSAYSADFSHPADCPQNGESKQCSDDVNVMGCIVNGRYVRKTNLESSVQSPEVASASCLVTDQRVPSYESKSNHRHDYSDWSQYSTLDYNADNLNKHHSFRRDFPCDNQDQKHERTYGPNKRKPDNIARNYHRSHYKDRGEATYKRDWNKSDKNFDHQSSQGSRHNDQKFDSASKNSTTHTGKSEDSVSSAHNEHCEAEVKARCSENEKLALSAGRIDSWLNNYDSGKRAAPSRERYKESTTQRDRLIVQLEKGQCECMVCCEHIKRRDYIWSCDNCYHIFHLKCIKKWARSPTAAVKDGGWRCPACQKITENVPYTYFCFCGKTKEPEVNAHYTPHTCGEMCGRPREDEHCTHKCNLLCHPGPCPPCLATVNRSCECGKTSKVVSCSQAEPVTCDNVCGKVLNCGVHTCKSLCHTGPCESCSTILDQECFCKAAKRVVICDEITSAQDHYSCSNTCDKLLACGHHKCSAICHPGPCGPCSLLVESVITCPCGKTSLDELYNAGKAAKRISCTDPIPTCGQKCEKELPCGPKDDHHKCLSDCHDGKCPPCPLVTVVKCQCSSTSKEVLCAELTVPYVFKCEKRCNKRKNCGRHKCLNHCCTLKNHICELVCNKKLSCGNHQCQELCHGGNCPTCWNVSFDELRCHCGYSVLYPPIHCGTRPPECDQPCARSHSCDHKVQHTCHSEPTCPPCTVLVEKLCFGGHETRSSVQCFLDGISCGKPCEKLLPCGKHKCKEVCHSGSCLKADAKCTQPCEALRSCGHPCSAPCHDGPCPETPCKAKVTVTCPCGFRSESATCSEDSSTYRLVSLSRMAAKMNDIKYGESVDIGDIFGKKNKYNRLLCNEDCAVHERNKRLALALQIQNPDLSCKPGPPTYSEFLKEEAKKNPKFVSGVYDKFAELVQLAKQSKQKSRSYAFPPMNRDHRRVVHEMAEFFGCETQSYDEEPVKNVVITAFKNRSFLPFVSLASVVEREMGLRRGPAPVINSASKVPVQVSMAEKKSKPIDYFDFEG